MHFVPRPSLHMGYAIASPYSFLWLVHNTFQDAWQQILPHLSCLSTQLRRQLVTHQLLTPSQQPPVISFEFSITDMRYQTPLYTHHVETPTPCFHTHVPIIATAVCCVVLIAVCDCVYMQVTKITVNCLSFHKFVQVVFCPRVSIYIIPYISAPVF